MVFSRMLYAFSSFIIWLMAILYAALLRLPSVKREPSTWFLWTRYEERVDGSQISRQANPL